MSKRGNKSLREEAIAKCEEHRACVLLTQRLTDSHLLEYERFRTRLGAQECNATLRGVIRDISLKVEAFRRDFDIRADRPKLLALLRRFDKMPKGRVVLLPKYEINDFFDFTKVEASFEALPAHACVEFRSHRDNEGHNLEVFLLEAVQFENMCALFNLTIDRQPLGKESKTEIKVRRSLESATLSAAFSFLEAYLNGLAADRLAEGDALSEADSDALREWDSKRSKRRTLTFREKLLKYPRIAARSEATLLQENNSPEMRSILETSKAQRDAIVHASALDSPEYGNKQAVLYSLTFKDVEQLVDNAIRLVEAIESNVHGDIRRSFWLTRRNSTGRFDEETFH
jgi:hypothetical protein